MKNFAILDKNNIHSLLNPKLIGQKTTNTSNIKTKTHTKNPTTISPKHEKMTIKLYTYLKSPNSQKITVFLELLQLKYTVIIIDLLSNEQKSQWFLQLNPIGRIPVLADDSNADEVVLFESGAILLYLSQVYDAEHRFSYSAGSDLYWIQLNWLMFESSSYSAVQSQFIFFKKLAELVDFTKSEEGDYSKQENEITLRYYRAETEKIFTVYNEQLRKNNDWFVGNGLNVADVSVLPLVLKAIEAQLVDINKYKNIKHWIEKMKMFEQVRRGLDIETYKTQ